jgi:hypothetical protein
MPRGVAHGRVVAAMLRIAFLQPFANARNSKEPGSTEMQERAERSVAPAAAKQDCPCSYRGTGADRYAALKQASVCISTATLCAKGGWQSLAYAALYDSEHSRHIQTPVPNASPKNIAASIGPAESPLTRN